MILFCFWLATRQRAITVKSEERIDLATLLVATLYAFLIPLKRNLSIVDTGVLVGLFVLYIVQSSQMKHEEPELDGPPAALAAWPRCWRRMATLALFLVPGYTIFIAAKPFADGLLHSAKGLGVEEFVLIQWLAPLASESPEFIVAILFALKRKPGAGFGALISSKVNQWTLLIGMLPLVYAVSAGHLSAMPLDPRQVEEILLTAAQSLLAVVILVNWRFGIWEGVLLLILFLAQLLIPITWVRILFAFLYLAISIAYLLDRTHRRAALDLLKTGWRISPPGSSSF